MILKKKKLIEWGVIIGVMVILYATGLHTQVIGKLQQAVLFTGLITPKVNDTSITPVKANYNWRITSADGEVIDLGDLKGKVLFINFWASWCPPCIAEMPGINSLYEEMTSEDVVFLMISRDNNFAKAKEFISSKGYTFPIYKVVGPLPEEFRSKVLPTTYVVSKNGDIVLKHNGMAQYDNQKTKEFLHSLTINAL